MSKPRDARDSPKRMEPQPTRSLFRLATCLACLMVQPAWATFSIVAFDPNTGDLGVAVQSKFFGVGSVVPFARAGVGAVATQSYANRNYGPDGLRKLAKGEKPEAVLRALTSVDARASMRQVGLVDGNGRSAAHTGEDCHDWAGHFTTNNLAIQGNLLASNEVVPAMRKGFEQARASGKGELAEWLLAALVAGQKAGGDKRGQQSAALLVVRKNGGFGGNNDRYIDLRVEDHARPIRELERLLELHRSVR